MLEVTKTAVDQFGKILSELAAEGRGIRIFKAGGGCCGTPSLGLDPVETPSKGDAIINKDGVRIYVDAAIAELLSTAVIDYDAGKNGFVISGLPGSSSECGSGSCS